MSGEISLGAHIHGVEEAVTAASGQLERARYADFVSAVADQLIRASDDQRLGIVDVALQSLVSGMPLDANQRQISVRFFGDLESALEAKRQVAASA